MNILFAIIMMGCNSDPKQDTGAVEVPESSLSECGQLVMEEGEPTAFDQCFESDGEVAYSCETCGYYSDVSLSQGAFDCITCFEGYEIDVIFGDCTGYCVPEGTAEVPMSESDCTPVTDCVRD